MFVLIILVMLLTLPRLFYRPMFFNPWFYRRRMMFRPRGMRHMFYHKWM